MRMGRKLPSRNCTANVYDATGTYCSLGASAASSMVGMLAQGFIDGLLLFAGQRAHTPFGQFPEGKKTDCNPHQAQHIHVN